MTALRYALARFFQLESASGLLLIAAAGRNQQQANRQPAKYQPPMQFRTQNAVAPRQSAPAAPYVD